MHPCRVFCLLLGLGIAASFANAKEKQESIGAIVQHVKSHRDGEQAWTIDFNALAGDRASLPIGVFDSGIGGLTVMNAILSLDEFQNDNLRPGPDGIPDFAGEKFIYFGDQANMPYGNYSAKGRTDFLRELILKDTIFLLGRRWREAAAKQVRRDKLPVKAIAIACNTATAYGLEDIRRALKEWDLDVPVIGVVEAGARAIAQAMPDDNRPRSVAVLATVGTCSSQAYPKAIASAVGRSGKRAPRVVQQGSVGLAGAIEGNPSFLISEAKAAERPVPYQGPATGNPAAPLQPELLPAFQFSSNGLLRDGSLNSVENYVRYDVVSLLERERQAGIPPIDTVVLGCTHFPLVQSELSEAFKRAREYTAPDGTKPFARLVAEEIQFVDPAAITARELFQELARRRIRNPARADRTAPTCEFYFSVAGAAAPKSSLAPDGSLTMEYKYGRLPGQLAVEDTVVIPLTPENLPSGSADLVRALPLVWRQLQNTTNQ